MDSPCIKVVLYKLSLHKKLKDVLLKHFIIKIVKCFLEEFLKIFCTVVADAS